MQLVWQDEEELNLDVKASDPHLKVRLGEKISMVESESDFHRLLYANHPHAGDDLAMLPNDQVIGVDQCLDGRHAIVADCGPAAFGRKAMNRCLSDIAAMAALPTAAVVTIAAPPGFGMAALLELQQGMTDAAARFGCPIVGGDTGSWQGPLCVTVTLLGESRGIGPVRRAGAQVGDGLYVSGPLGGSIHGRHLTFTPQIALARQLVPRGVTAMMDLSDGLAMDLPRLCAASGVGAMLEAARIPVHKDAADLHHALTDGEDYELLFTAAPVARFDGITPSPHLIGRVTAGRELLLDGRPLPAGGWDHPLT